MYSFCIAVIVAKRASGLPCASDHPKEINRPSNILIMFSPNHGKPHTETYHFSATPTLSDFPLLIGEIAPIAGRRLGYGGRRQ
jgi:hypothetical protein